MRKTNNTNDADHSFYFFVSTFLLVALSSAYVLSKVEIPEIAWRSLLLLLVVLGGALGLSFFLELLDDLEIMALIIGFVLAAFTLYRVLSYLLSIDFFVALIQVMFIVLFSGLLLVFLSRLILELDFLIKLTPVIVLCLTLVFLLAQTEGLFYSSLAAVFGALMVYFVMTKKKPRTGPERLVSTIGIALDDFVREEPKTTDYYYGKVKLGSVIWKARSQSKLYKGDPIVVLELWERLTLNVGPKKTQQDEGLTSVE